MDDRHRRILQMLAEGKINVDEAERLLKVLDEKDRDAKSVEQGIEPMKRDPKFFRIMVSGGDSERVDMRIPLQLIRAGMKFSSFLPDGARVKIDKAFQEKGIQFSSDDISKNLDEITAGLSEFRINIVDGSDKVAIFCE